MKFRECRNFGTHLCASLEEVNNKVMKEIKKETRDVFIPEAEKMEMCSSIRPSEQRIF